VENVRLKLGVLIMSIGFSLMPKSWQNENAIRNLILINAIDHRINWFRIVVNFVAWSVVAILWAVFIF